MHAIHSEMHVEHFDRDQKTASVGKEAETSVESCNTDARVHDLSALCEDAHSPLAQRGATVLHWKVVQPVGRSPAAIGPKANT